MPDLQLESAIDRAIYEKYILPTRRPRKAVAGLEFELPIVNLEQAAVDFDFIHAVTEEFVRESGFTRQVRDANGHLYNALEPETGDDLSFDCSYNTLEFSFGKETDLNVLHDRFRKYYRSFEEKLLAGHHTLTGMGLNPYFAYNRAEPIANGRYRMLLHHLQSYPKYGSAIPFHDMPTFGLACCASQVQLDVEEDSLLKVLNTFNKLEPLKALLFANSPYQEFLCSRDYFWKYSMHGLNPHNLDLCVTELHSEEEVITYIRSMSLYCLERDGKYVNFRPTQLEPYFSLPAVTGEYFEESDGTYHEYTWEPRLSDLDYLRSFKFVDLTYRGTIEFRSACEQPVREIMTPAALQTGLMENVTKLSRILAENTFIYQQGYNTQELRELFVKRELPDFLDREATSELLLRILDLAADGLEKRGRGERKLLEPLYHRAEHLLSPARQMVEGLESGVPLEFYIHDYAAL